ncbi:hypothetical protein HS1genome_0424 [Sulfodiicoccus acidiphilus]|uniref:FAD-binding PCMH-type domain-containing protein n=1 Tax=Sulfodiicoccus acidiphilus TaxID=1670455 RepID=A0A348B1I3_9CREN|nr:hypothetical protein HS1genome_0424 [Sulfodiicoccus acidiphilus]
MSLLEELKRELDGIDVSIEERTDFSGYGVSPLAVVFAESEDHVVRTLIFANRKGLKVVPWGGGTSVTGALKCEGCVLLDLSRMRKIVEINDVDWYVRVQPGVVLDELNRELERRGFFLPPDPSSSFMCTVGGQLSRTPEA